MRVAMSPNRICRIEGIPPGLGEPQRNLHDGIVNLDGRGMLVVSVARRLGSEVRLLAYYAARFKLPALNRAGSQKGALGALS
jgi:hypothetical protein